LEIKIKIWLLVFSVPAQADGILDKAVLPVHPGS
jgi:hypothetical protein